MIVRWWGNKHSSRPLNRALVCCDAIVLLHCIIEWEDQDTVGRSVYPRRCEVDCRNNLTTTRMSIREIKEKKNENKHPMRKFTVKARVLMAIEKNSKRSFVFITALHMRNYHACNNKAWRVCSTECKKKLRFRTLRVRKSLLNELNNLRHWSYKSFLVTNWFRVCLNMKKNGRIMLT